MITYFRDSAMPDSPDTKIGSHPLPHPHPPPALNMTSSRPLSASSSISGMNGSHSPLSGINGRTPSPPSLGPMMGGGMGQQLPPACGARQLSKLKRFLTTLQQFGSDISPEIGERVRTLVLGLVNSHLSIEEFHAKLQEATNFPLRPFVIPFLKANLPLLQRELMHCARLAKQTPQQFLTQNEHVVFDPTHSPLDLHGDSPASDLNENGKRRSPESSGRGKESGSVDSFIAESLHPAKRHHPSGSSPLAPRVSPNGSLNLNLNLGSGAPIRLEDISLSREMRERERLERERAERERAERERERERERDRDRHFSGNYGYSRSDSFETVDRLDEDWRHVETMLNCIVGMVDKTKRALAVLQERSLRDREEVAAWLRRQAEGVEQDVKKHAAHDVMAAFHVSRHHHDDRLSDIRRRAEEAVNEVKRQAVLELQKAVQAAESKASEMVMSERLKMERVLQQARSQARDELLGAINHQEESSESCWNCGRKASETCSGCNVARYCGPFCQHKDWESHHLVCGKATVASIAQARDQRRAGLAATPSSVALTSSSTSSAAMPAVVSSLPSSSSSASSASSSSSSTSKDHPVTSTATPEGAAIPTSAAVSGDVTLSSNGPAIDVKVSSPPVKIESDREVSKVEPSR